MALDFVNGKNHQHLNPNDRTIAAFNSPVPVWALDRVDDYKREMNFRTRSEALIALLQAGSAARSALQSQGIAPLAIDRKIIRDCESLRLQLPQSIVNDCQNSDRRNPGWALGRLIEDAISARSHFAAVAGDQQQATAEQATEQTEETEAETDCVAVARSKVADAWKTREQSTESVAARSMASAREAIANAWKN